MYASKRQISQSSRSRFLSNTSRSKEKRRHHSPQKIRNSSQKSMTRAGSKTQIQNVNLRKAYDSKFSELKELRHQGLQFKKAQAVGNRLTQQHSQPLITDIKRYSQRRHNYKSVLPQPRGVGLYTQPGRTKSTLSKRSKDITCSKKKTSKNYRTSSSNNKKPPHQSTPLRQRKNNMLIQKQTSLHYYDSRKHSKSRDVSDSFKENKFYKTDMPSTFQSQMGMQSSQNYIKTDDDYLRDSGALRNTDISPLRDTGLAQKH
jgi:hypothetical protein